MPDRLPPPRGGEVPGQGTVSPPAPIEGTGPEGARTAQIASSASPFVSPSLPVEGHQGTSGGTRTQRRREVVDPETGEVTFLPPAGASDPSDVSSTESTSGASRQDTESGAAQRRQRRGHLRKLRRISQKYTVIKRKKACGQVPVDGTTGEVGILIREGGRAGFGGLMRCESSTCPSCASDKAAKKAEEEELLLRDHQEQGGCVLFVTLTFPHNWGQAFKPMREAVAGAWRAMTGYRAWKKMRDKYGLTWTKCIEDTHGGNGWHPHLHALLRLNRDLQEGELEQLQVLVYELWSKQMTSRGYRPPAPECCPVELVKDNGKAAAYIAKLGLSLEVTAPTTKQARAGHRSPWQILEDVGERGRGRDIALWQEWERGCKGKSFVTRCKASRERLKVLLRDQAELEDEEQDEVKTVAVMRRKTWAKVRTIRGMGTRLLDAAERGGHQGVERVLAQLDWPPGYDPLLPEVAQWEDDWPGGATPDSTLDNISRHRGE